MTDDEINQSIDRQVAEIEDWHPSPDSLASVKALYYSPPYTTDWAWCGPLIKKHGIDLYWYPDDGDGDGDRWIASSFGVEGMLCDSPQIAICVAVMAANQHRPSIARTWTGLGDK